MDIQLNLNMGTENEQVTEEKAKEAKKKQAKAKYEPSWSEVWTTGYGSKKGIFQTKLSDLDHERLQEVKKAIDSGELSTGVETLTKFSKSHALALYKILKEQRKDATIRTMVANKPRNYHLITSVGQFNHMAELLNLETEIAVDTETNGLDYDKNHIVGLSLTLPLSDYHCYIPIRHENVAEFEQLSPEFVFGRLKAYLEDEQRRKYLFNFKFDAHMFYREGIYVKGLEMDGLIAFKCLNENEPSYALKNLATKYGRYFGFEDKSSTYEDLFGKGGFENTPLDIGTVYACKDTHLTYKFCKWIETQFNRLPKLAKLYYEIERPVAYTCFDMELNGMKIDLSFAEKYKGELQEQIEQLKAQLDQTFGGINFDSPTQLAKLLFDDWGLDDVSGKRSVDKKVLKILGEKNEAIKTLLEYRALNKLLSTYLEPLPQMIWKRDHRLHGTFNQIGADTGRMSSNNPNMQNLPGNARQMFVSEPGNIIIGTDFGAIEPRVLAHLSKDKGLQEPFIKGTDIYASLAAPVFNKPYEECGDGTKERKAMKFGLLSSMYGTGDTTLAGQLKITVEEAHKFKDDFYANFPVMAAYIAGNEEYANVNEYVETIYGRKRRFPGHKAIADQYKKIAPKRQAITKQVEEFNGGKAFEPLDMKSKLLPAELKRKYWDVNKAFWNVARDYNRVARQATNAIIQGSSADIMKLGLMAVNDYCKKMTEQTGKTWRILAVIHDEVLTEAPEGATEEQIRGLAAAMTGVITLDVPIVSDVEIYRRWGKAVKLKQWLEDSSCLDE